MISKITNLLKKTPEERDELAVDMVFKFLAVNQFIIVIACVVGMTLLFIL